jgi:hypothetical protein
MTRQTHPFCSSLLRSLALAALVGAAFVASPLSPARADGQLLAQNTPTQSTTHKPPAAAAATSQRPDTVEQRITELHADLKITPEQESKWNSVAQAMRENASNMEKLVAEKRTKPPQNMTAVDDLSTYREFAQAHVDGLKNLISSFTSLYDSMPDAQKKNADRVFQDFGREG